MKKRARNKAKQTKDTISVFVIWRVTRGEVEFLVCQNELCEAGQLVVFPSYSTRAEERIDRGLLVYGSTGLEPADSQRITEISVQESDQYLKRFHILSFYDCYREPDPALTWLSVHRLEEVLHSDHILGLRRGVAHLQKEVPEEAVAVHQSLQL